MRFLKESASILFISALVVACASNEPVVVVVRTVDVGFGFSDVEKEFRYARSGVDHYRFLYYLDRNLGMTTRYSISPGGKFAAYQNRVTNEIMVFDVRKSVARPILLGAQRTIRKFEWTDSTTHVRIVFREGDGVDAEL